MEEKCKDPVFQKRWSTPEGPMGKWRAMPAESKKKNAPLVLSTVVEDVEKRGKTLRQVGGIFWPKEIYIHLSTRCMTVNERRPGPTALNRVELVTCTYFSSP